MGIKRINSLADQALANQPVHATFASTGLAAGKLVVVAVQLQDQNRNNLSVRAVVPFWLSTEANGDLELTTEISCSLGNGTDGNVIRSDEGATGGTIGSNGLLISESDGDIDLSMGDCFTRSVFIHLAMPNGTIVSSSSISLTSA